MVLCPIAIAIGCKKCSIFAICPVKGFIGDYKPDEPPKHVAKPVKVRSGAKK